MEITVIRTRQNGFTSGELFIDGVHECFTCEDEVREVPGEPVEKWKVYGKTAIPARRFRVTITFSNRFQRDLPLIMDVPGYTGVRAHPGNTAADTDGCLLPGTVATATGVAHSVVAFDALFVKIKAAIDAAEEVWITFTNPPESIS